MVERIGYKQPLRMLKMMSENIKKVDVGVSENNIYMLLNIIIDYNMDIYIIAVKVVYLS